MVRGLLIENSPALIYAPTQNLWPHTGCAGSSDLRRISAGLICEIDLHTQPWLMQVTDPDFQQWIVRVRSGDAEAAQELVRRYEKSVRIAIRFKLTSPSMRRQFDSMDVCQSVLASFFCRVAIGEYDLQTPEQLVGLLVRMAENKLKMKYRHHKQQKRDLSRIEADVMDQTAVRAPVPGPEQQTQAREILDRLYAHLTPDEHAVAALRSLGMTWPEVARSLDQTEQAVRMRLTRALDRLSEKLGLDELTL